MAVPLAIAGIQAGLGLIQGISGLVTQNRSRKKLEQLSKERPYNGVPSAWEKLAREPVSAQYMKMQEDFDAANTGGAIGAISKGDSRASANLAGLIKGATDRTRQRFGDYERARIEALSGYGAARERSMGRKQDAWSVIMQGAQQANAEGRQAMFGGLGNIARGGAYALENWEGLGGNTTPSIPDGGMNKTYMNDEQLNEALRKQMAKRVPQFNFNPPKQ